MLEDIEAKVKGNYIAKKHLNQADVNVRKEKSKGQLDNLNNMVKRMEELQNMSHLQRYYCFNQLMEDLTSLDQPLEDITEHLTFLVNPETSRHCDDQLYKSMFELFVTDMKTKDFTETAKELYSYKPSKGFEDTLKNGESVKAYIEEKSNSGFVLKGTGILILTFWLLWSAFNI